MFLATVAINNYRASLDLGEFEDRSKAHCAVQAKLNELYLDQWIRRDAETYKLAGQSDDHMPVALVADVTHLQKIMQQIISSDKRGCEG